jgi:acetyl esterase/lipase
MALQLDPEIQAALVPLMAVMDGMPKLPAGDVEGRRTAFAGVLGAMFATLSIPTDVTTKDYYTTTTDGHSLLLRWITKTPSAAGTPTPAVVYAHGGGELCSFQGRLSFSRTNFLK